MRTLTWLGLSETERARLGETRPRGAALCAGLLTPHSLRPKVSEEAADHRSTDRRALETRAERNLETRAERNLETRAERNLETRAERRSGDRRGLETRAERNLETRAERNLTSA